MLDGILVIIFPDHSEGIQGLTQCGITGQFQDPQGVTCLLETTDLGAQPLAKNGGYGFRRDRWALVPKPLLKSLGCRDELLTVQSSLTNSHRQRPEPGVVRKLFASLRRQGVLDLLTLCRDDDLASA